MNKKDEKKKAAKYDPTLTAEEKKDARKLTGKECDHVPARPLTRRGYGTCPRKPWTITRLWKDGSTPSMLARMRWTTCDSRQIISRLSVLRTADRTRAPSRTRPIWHIPRRPCRISAPGTRWNSAGIRPRPPDCSPSCHFPFPTGRPSVSNMPALLSSFTTSVALYIRLSFCDCCHFNEPT